MLHLTARRAPGVQPVDLIVWIDTAFTGELVLPRDTVAEKALSQSSVVIADLADGAEVVLDTYTCIAA